MNSRGDWGQNLPPQLYTENGRQKRKYEDRRGKMAPRGADSHTPHPSSERIKNITSSEVSSIEADNLEVSRCDKKARLTLEGEGGLNMPTPKVQSQKSPG